MSEVEISYFNKVIYECDICKKVCTKNKGINYHLHPEYEPSGIENINLVELLSMTNKEFKSVYGNNAASWTGALVLKRNAVCALGNQGIKSATLDIKKSIEKYKDVSWYNETANSVLKMLESE